MKPENMKQVVFRGDRLRIARRARKMSQDELASQVSISRTTITNLEGGFAETSLRTLVEMAYALKVSTDYLLDMTEGKDEILRLPPDERAVLEAYRAGDAAAYMRLFSERREQ